MVYTEIFQRCKLHVGLTTAPGPPTLVGCAPVAPDYMSTAEHNESPWNLWRIANRGLQRA